MTVSSAASPFGPPPALDEELVAGDAGLALALAHLREHGYAGLTAQHLGSGRYGNVYRVENAERRSVAVKTVRETTAVALRRLLREAAFLRRAEPATPRPFALTDEPTPYLLMEHVEGGTVPDLWARIRQQVSGVRVAIAAAAATGMRRVSEAGILHLDCSTGNLAVERSGNVRVLDLGFAEDLPTTETAIPGGPRGTVAYMAPEQLRGRMHPRTDVFGLGAVLFECLSGRRLALALVPDLSPTQAIAASQLAEHYRTQDAQLQLDMTVADMPGLSDEWRGILLEMLRLDPASRMTPAEADRAWNALPRTPASSLFRPMPVFASDAPEAMVPLTSGHEASAGSGTA